MSEVRNTSAMFCRAHNFNQPLNRWNLGNVTDMNKMFYRATSFNQPLEDWAIYNVVDMTEMFYGAINFNQSLAKWIISVETTRYNNMFSEEFKNDIPEVLD